MIKPLISLVAFACLSACTEQNTFHVCTYNSFRDIPNGVELFQNRQFDELAAFVEPDAIAGDPAAQEFLGNILYESDPEEAFRWLSLAANQQCENAALMLGQMYEDGQGVEENPELAFQWFLRLAESGNPNAAILVSHMYLDGKGVKQNEDLYYYWLERATELSPANQ